MKQAFRVDKITVGVALALGAVVLDAPRYQAQGPTGDTSTPIKHLVVIFQENVSFDR